MNEAIIAAIAAAVGGILTILGKVVVDIIKAKKEPDQSDLELKDELEREKEKNNNAIEMFKQVAAELRSSINCVNENVNQLSEKIEDYREETREINKSELRHSITEIYFEHCKEKSFDLNTKNDLCSLYEAYSGIGGNSFAKELYEEMMDWDVK